VGDYFPVQNGPVTTVERPHRRNNSRAGEPPKRTAGMTASPPAVAGLNSALLAVRQLLNNPPSTGVSPSAAEQWRHNVDRLIVAVIKSPHRERRRQPSAHQSCFLSATRVPSVVQASPVLPGARPSAQHRAPMASYTMMDLMEEINRRRGGEDSRTTIERHHERHRDIEGCNLEKDFNMHAPVGGRQVAHAPLPPNSPGVSEGAWHWPHTYVWWFGRASSSPTC
jgi:hypothetical protein